MPLDTTDKVNKKKCQKPLLEFSISLFISKGDKEIHSVECQLCSPSPQVPQVMLETERQKEVEVTIA